MCGLLFFGGNVNIDCLRHWSFTIHKKRGTIFRKKFWTTRSNRVVFALLGQEPDNEETWNTSHETRKPSEQQGNGDIIQEDMNSLINELVRYVAKSG
jgi:hypothetical protein